MEEEIDDFIYDLEELITFDHPNIARVLEYREDAHNFYILEEFSNGKKLFS